MARHLINIRVTKSEHELLKTRARAGGLTLTGFIIKRCLSNSLWVEDKINEIHKAICKNE